MNAAFVDTSFLLALASPADALHARAVAWRFALPGPFITSDFILLELADGLASRRGRDAAIQIIDSLRAGPSTAVVDASAEWIQRGYELFRTRGDKEWGLTDCISFEIMRDLGLTDALTYDHHYEQAGFHALLRHDPPGP